MEEFLKNYLLLDFNFLVPLFISVLGGFVIGAERELTNKWAGLRTHILVCVGSCVFTLLSLNGFPPHLNPAGGAAVGDPARIAAQIITGIGFIGGGTVLRQGVTIQGLTTASTLWVCAAIGMAAGCGKSALAITTTIFAIIVLVLIRMIEKRLLHNNKKNLLLVKITVKIPKEKQEELYTFLSQNVKNMFDFNSTKEDNKNFVKLSMKAEVFKNDNVPDIYKKLSETDYVENVSIQEVLN